MSSNEKLVEILRLIEEILKSPHNFTEGEQTQLKQIAEDLYFNRHHHIDDFDSLISSFRDVLENQ
ncbi:MAG: hypothetical protein ACXAD7_11090 [Candidatus Kariarchaeaceae archaeon]|jgi:hypothetical protein